MADDARLRIGELSKRTGISPELLRAWETRYGLVDPERTPGGLRLYSAEDERRVREMQRQIAGGLSAAEAAGVATQRPAAATVSVQQLLGELDRTLTALDEPAAQAALDHIFEALDLEAAIGQVILPFLRDLGTRWAATERSVGQEHFASNVIGGRLRTLARGWGDGDGLRALLACPPGEQHELGLICFGLLLRNHGWSITYLGANTPTPDLVSASSGLSPELVVLSAMDPERFIDASNDLRSISSGGRLAIGGVGVSTSLAESLGAELLDANLVAAARAVSGVEY